MGKILHFPPGAPTARDVLKVVLRDHSKELVDCIIIGWDAKDDLVLYATSHSWTLLHSASCVLADLGIKSINGELGE